jgi:hypothetical protein
MCLSLRELSEKCSQNLSSPLGDRIDSKMPANPTALLAKMAIIPNKNPASLFRQAGFLFEVYSALSAFS